MLKQTAITLGSIVSAVKLNIPVYFSPQRLEILGGGMVL